MKFFDFQTVFIRTCHRISWTLSLGYNLFPSGLSLRHYDIDLDTDAFREFEGKGNAHSIFAAQRVKTPLAEIKWFQVSSLRNHILRALVRGPHKVSLKEIFRHMRLRGLSSLCLYTWTIVHTSGNTLNKSGYISGGFLNGGPWGYNNFLHPRVIYAAQKISIIADIRMETWASSSRYSDFGEEEVCDALLVVGIHQKWKSGITVASRSVTGVTYDNNRLEWAACSLDGMHSLSVWYTRGNSTSGASGYREGIEIYGKWRVASQICGPELKPACRTIGGCNVRHWSSCKLLARFSEWS